MRLSNFVVGPTRLMTKRDRGLFCRSIPLLCLFVLNLTQVRAGIVTQGSTNVQRPNQDSGPGGVYIYNGGNFVNGQTVDQFQWFAPVFAGTDHITPLLLTDNNGQFTVVAIGLTAAFMSSVSPGAVDAITLDSPQAGSNLVTGNNWTFGFFEGSANASGMVTQKTAGGVAFDTPVDAPPGIGGAGTTNDWVFTPGVVDATITTVALGTTFGTNGTYALNNPSLGGSNVDRTYSANASEVPEPGTFGLITGALILLGLFRYRTSKLGACNCLRPNDPIESPDLPSRTSYSAG